MSTHQKIEWKVFTDILSKRSNKTYSEAVIGQFELLFRKRTSIMQVFHQLV